MKFDEYMDKVVMACFILLIGYAYLNQDAWQLYDYKAKYGAIIISLVGLAVTYMKLTPKLSIPQYLSYPVSSQAQPE